MYIDLKLKYRNMKIRICHDKRTVSWDTVISLLFKPLVDVSSFRLSRSLYSRSVLFKCTNHFRSVFPDVLDRWIYETMFPSHARVFFPPCIFFFCNQSIFFRSSNHVIGACSHVITLSDVGKWWEPLCTKWITVIYHYHRRGLEFI